MSNYTSGIKPVEDFDWSAYEDGWNGNSRKANTKLKTKGKDVVYSHEPYAEELHKMYEGVKGDINKDIAKGSSVSITDLIVVNDSTVLATVNNGTNNIIIDLDKENRFLSNLTLGTEAMTKSMFVEALQNAELKEKILSMDLTAKVGKDCGKGSIWDGYVENLANEMKAQVSLNNKAYMAKIISINKGGFLVKVADVISAFMPGSMVAANKINNYADYIGKSLEVMVESYDERIGFVVSHKKYLRRIMPAKLAELENELANNKNLVLTGTVTGSTMFGIFVELTEVLTGMLHKSLVSDETRLAMRNGEIKPGTKVQVYVHKIENNKIVLSDVAPEQRDEVIKRREAEDAAEKSSRR